MKKIFLIFLIFFVCLALLIYNRVNSNNNYHRFDNNRFIFSKINNYKMKKILIVGDSRMFIISEEAETLKIPKNISFYALGGAKISFLQGESLSKILEKLNAMKKNEDNYVIFNLGVNDLNPRELDVEEIAIKYFKIYKFFVKKYKYIKFVFLSVNPVVEDKLSSNVFMTNKKITKFNSYMQKFIQNLNYDNFTFLDSYNSIEFDTYDGVHYTSETDKEIIDYIVTMILSS